MLTENGQYWPWLGICGVLGDLAPPEICAAGVSDDGLCSEKPNLNWVPNFGYTERMQDKHTSLVSTLRAV